MIQKPEIQKCIWRNQNGQELRNLQVIPGMKIGQQGESLWLKLAGARD